MFQFLAVTRAGYRRFIPRRLLHRFTTRQTLLVIAAVVQSILPATVNAAKAERPNVILIMTDDQGIGDLGFHGNKAIRTPNMDQFAKEGIRFTQFYVCPVCAPTRASLMTGRDFYRTGVIHTSRGAAKMHSDELTVAEHLRGAGYRTGIFGKWHLGDNYPMRPQDQGFEETLVLRSGGITQTPDVPNSYFDSLLWKNGEEYHAQGYCTDVFFDAAMEFIARPSNKPFFAYIPTNAPHTPLQVDERYAEPYRKQGLDDTTARVYGMIENIDDNLGRLTAFLDERGLRKNTLVIFLTDNGAQHVRYNAGFRGHKASTYEGGIRVPCFWQWPARWKGDRDIPTMAAHIDVFRTLAAICAPDRPIKAKQDGVSLLPLLDQTGVDWPERTLYLQVHRGLDPQPFQNSAVITQRWKLVGYPGTFGKEGFETSTDNPVVELYDLQNDPGEQKNLASEKLELTQEFCQKYLKWFASVKAERNFEPGVIVLGDDHAKEVLLCRYQDGTWIKNRMTGWLVDVVRGGTYHFHVRLDDRANEENVVRVAWQGQQKEFLLAAGEADGNVVLDKGKGNLVIEVIDPKTGGPAQLRSATGDVTVTLAE